MKEIPKATPEQEEAVKRFERERSETVRLVEAEWQNKKKLKQDEKKKSKK